MQTKVHKTKKTKSVIFKILYMVVDQSAVCGTRKLGFLLGDEEDTVARVFW
jgi:hypothetical protein